MKSLSRFVLTALLLLGVGHTARTAPPNAQAVSQRIDQLIQQELERARIPASPLADDAQFLRRATLDLTGRLPTPEQTAAFLDSTTPQKRRQLIDELLASPRYGEYLASRWIDLIQANGTPPRSMVPAFRSWLTAQLNEGRGWDRIVHTMITAEGTSRDSPASWYLRANVKEPGRQAEMTARFFLGVQVQCAECHDHPFTSWKQTDYWGLAAFFTRLNQVNVKEGQQLSEALPPNKKPPAQGTGARIVIGTQGVKVGGGKVVAARFLGGATPTLPDTGPLMPTLADWMTDKNNPWFARAAVNRTWGHFFGVGFVNPLDDFTPDAKPSHPALLELLAAEFTASGYDLKHLMRCLCNTQAYQRSSQPLPQNRADQSRFSHMAVKVMAPDVLFDSLVAALGNPKLAAGLGSPLPYELYAPKPTRAATLQAREEFLKYFETRSDTDATTTYTQGIPQVLALMNARSLNNVPPIVDNLIKSNASKEKAIETLFLAALTRRPTADETRLLLGYLSRRQEPRQGYAGVLWILINSAEFVLNP